MREASRGVGATIMGRGMFGGGSGPWPEPAWNGWWGENPPYHTPVFVLTHHPRDPLEMDGGTTFHFVTDGIQPALERAREAAAGKHVRIGGGASVANQYLAAGLVDELSIHLVPKFIGGGARLFDGFGGNRPKLELVRTIPAEKVTHLKYRVVRD
jgi:dihydrofolate reductase